MADLKNYQLDADELDGVSGGNNNMEALQKCPRCKTFQIKSSFSKVNGYCKNCNDELAKSGSVSRRGI